MAIRSSKSFILYCVALLATVTGISGQALGEQLGDRTDPLNVELTISGETAGAKFEMESPDTEVATVGAPGTFSSSIMDFDAAGLMSSAQDLAWDEPLVASSPARKRPAVAEPKPRSFDVTPTAGAIPTVAADDTVPTSTYSAVPEDLIEEIGRDETEKSSVFSVNPEPSGKTLLAALLGSLVLIGGFTHVFRPRREEVQPIRF